MLHIIQNDPAVPPGNILDGLGISHTVHHPYRGDRLPDVGAVSALIVMGGAMGANDDDRYPFLSALKNLIRAAVAARIPFLGICLGGQLLAAACGARVLSHRWEELGTLNVALTEAGKTDSLFRGITEEFTTFQWHHDSFDIPDGGVLLATSAACRHQAFRVGDSAWGLQFHPEVTQAIIRDWCAWDCSTAAQTEELITLFSREKERYRTTARLLRDNFLLSAGMNR